VIARAAVSLGLGLSLAAGCASDDDTPGGDPGGDAFLLGTRVWDDTQTTSYFHVVPSLEPGTTVDTTQAVEVPGSAKLYAVPGIGWFAIGAGEAPTITRYTLEDGRLVAGTAMSFQAYGVKSLWPTLYVVSPTKAYYPDREGQQLLVWNPTTMEITGSIALPATARDGYLSLYGYTPVMRGDALLFSVGWFDWTNDRVLAETGLVVIDTTTDTVARVDVDTRCAGITETVVTASGDAYLATSALAASAHRLGKLATAPCALRIAAGADAFDPGYVRALDGLAGLTGGAIAGEPVPGGGDRLFLRVLDEGAATIDPAGPTWNVTGQTAWQWWSWDVAADTATRVDLASATADVLWFQVGDRVFGAQTTADYAETTLVELNADGGPQVALTAPGFLHGVARIR
jgi:hypothetical protein